MKRWHLSVISLLVLSVVLLVWAIASGRFASRDEKMRHRFETIQRNIDASDLQLWATNILSNYPNGRVWNIPKFVQQGSSDTHLLLASTFIHQEAGTGIRSVWLPFGDISDSWWLMIGDSKFTLPLTNSSNRAYCMKWIPGVYFCYER